MRHRPKEVDASKGAETWTVAPISPWAFVANPSPPNQRFMANGRKKKYDANPKVAEAINCHSNEAPRPATKAPPNAATPTHAAIMPETRISKIHKAKASNIQSCQAVHSMPTS
jgi:hypothetical protein